MSHVALSVLFFLTLSSQSYAFSRAQTAPVPDPVTKSSIVNGDATAMIEGCGNQPIVGFTYCRQVEGDSAAKSVWFIGPPADCDRAACVFIKVFNSQGQLAWGGSIPKGQTRVEVPWKTLLAADKFVMGDRGFWTFNLTVYWKDANGRENQSVSQGDIVLRVYQLSYLPLNAVADDPAFAWQWVDAGHVFKVTTGLRAFIGSAT